MAWTPVSKRTTIWVDVKTPTGDGWGTAAWGSSAWGGGSGGISTTWTTILKQTTIWTDV